MTAIDPSRVQRILIRANNWIGDVVMISPAVRAIREHFDRARIAILAKRWVLEALRGNPYYDELFEYDSEGIHRGAAGRLRLVRELRRARFDLAILFQKAFEAAALAFLAAVPMRVGYVSDSRRLLLTHPVPLPPPETHHLEAFLGIARALGCPVRDPYPFFHLDAEAQERARDLLESVGRAPGSPLVALHPGSSKSPRAWHAERFALLGRDLTEKVGAQIVLLGGPADEALLEQIASSLPPPSLLLSSPNLSIREMAAILERCHLFVGNDSGPMHVAAALGVPTVGIFGPGSPERSSPRAREGRVQVVGKAYPCSPCRQDFFRECAPSPAGKPFCLEEIPVAEVEAAALELLRAARA